MAPSIVNWKFGASAILFGGWRKLLPTADVALANDAAEIATEIAAELRRLSSLAQTPAPIISGKTLYEALEGYGKFAVLKSSKAQGDHEAVCARRLMKSHDAPSVARAFAVLRATPGSSVEFMSALTTEEYSTATP